MSRSNSKFLIIVFGLAALLVSLTGCALNEPEDKQEYPTFSSVVWEFESITDEISPEAITYEEAALILAQYIETHFGRSAGDLVVLVQFTNESWQKRREGEFWRLMISTTFTAIHFNEVIYFAEVDAITGGVRFVQLQGQLLSEFPERGFNPFRAAGESIPWWDGRFTFDEMVNSENVFKLQQQDFVDDFLSITVNLADIKGEAHEGRLNLLCADTGEVIPVVVRGMDTGITRIIYSRINREDGTIVADFGMGVLVGVHPPN
ncbi:MAG: hypothetical protein FWE21_01170 [Defluviitaleaceae bacterium]|nr:hypothetical protein [Defluviitaleaceae bacterium]